MLTTTNLYLKELYPFPAIRGIRITRLPEGKLGNFALDAETAEVLGRRNVGVFVGGCTGLDWIVEKADVLAATDFPGVWVVVLSTKKMAAIVSNKQREKEGRRPVKHAPRYWQRGNAVYTTPEGLYSYAKDRSPETRTAGILLVDTLCHVHMARGEDRLGWNVNDRPQRIADFRADVTVDGWAPPLLLLTRKPAKSVNTASMVSPYCLNAWWFVDGARLRVGRPPATSACHIHRSLGIEG